MKVRRILSKVAVVCVVGILVVLLAARVYCHRSVASIVRGPTLRVGIQTWNHGPNVRRLEVADRQVIDRLSSLILSRKHRIAHEYAAVDVCDYLVVENPRYRGLSLLVYGNIVVVETGSGVAFRLTYPEEDDMFVQARNLIEDEAASVK